MSFTSAHLFFEDLEIGQSWVSLGRTITEADIVHFAGISGDFNPIHVDHHFARPHAVPQANRAWDAGVRHRQRPGGEQPAGSDAGLSGGAGLAVPRACLPRRHDPSARHRDRKDRPRSGPARRDRVETRNPQSRGQSRPRRRADDARRSPRSQAATSPDTRSTGLPYR